MDPIDKLNNSKRNILAVAWTVLETVICIVAILGIPYLIGYFIAPTILPEEPLLIDYFIVWLFGLASIGVIAGITTIIDLFAGELLDSLKSKFNKNKDKIGNKFDL